MTVHMVRLYVEPPNGNAQQAVSNWVANYSQWEGDPVEHGLTETTTEPYGDGGTAYLAGDWRFLDEREDPTAVLADLHDRLESFQGGLWHRAGYHVCEHDEGEPSACGWEQTVEGGTVPADIPTFEVSG